MVEALDMVGYYVPNMKQVGTYIFCTKLSRKDAVSFLKRMGCYESFDTLQPESLFTQEVYQKYCHFKLENVDAWDSTKEEINAIVSSKDKEEEKG